METCIFQRKSERLSGGHDGRKRGLDSWKQASENTTMIYRKNIGIVKKKGSSFIHAFNIMQLPCQPVTSLLLLWRKWEMLLGYCAIMENHILALVFQPRNKPGQDENNNSPRCQRAPLCRPTYGPWWWPVAQGAWPEVCARGPVYWCQESPGLRDAALLRRPLVLGLALPWCTALLTAQPAEKTEKSETQKSFVFVYIHHLHTNTKKFSWRLVKKKVTAAVWRLLLQSTGGAAGEIQWMHQGPEDRLHNLLCHTNRVIANAVFALAANGW